MAAEALQITDLATKRSTNTGNVCLNQCGILISAFGRVEQFLIQVQEIAKRSEGALVWDETMLVLRRGLQLLKSCQESDWIVWGLLFEESYEEFQCVYNEIYECIELIKSYLSHVDPSNSQDITEAHNSFRELWTSNEELETASLNDRLQLMGLVLRQAEGESEERKRAKKLLGLKLLGKQPAIQYSEITIAEAIGEGAFGMVCEATWLGHGFAVKVFRSYDTSFQTELNILATYKHPNVLHIAGHSHVEPPRNHYLLVMEKMEKDLARYIRAKNYPLQPLSIVQVMLPIATGMAWLHSKGVIHRDLKPQNILVGEEDNVIIIRIADFGASKNNFKTGENTMRGTLNFMAPEVKNGEYYSRKADVYSFAMLCYQLCTGKLTFESVMAQGVRPDIPDECPDFFKKLMLDCWSQNAKERPKFSDICQRLKKFKAELLEEDIRGTLLKLINNAQMDEAFQHALSCNDPSVVWWLCTKVNLSVLNHFTACKVLYKQETILLEIAEQINTNYAEDTALKLHWMSETINLLCQEALASDRKLKILKRVSENLAFAASMSQESDLQGYVTRVRDITEELLKRVQDAIQAKELENGRNATEDSTAPAGEERKNFLRSLLACWNSS